MSGGLKNKVAYGFLWNSIGTISAGLIGFMVTMILARILTPADFGVVAILLIFSSICAIIIEGGFSQAIIREKDVSQTDLSSVFFLNIIVAIFLYLLLFFLAPCIASFFEAPILIPLSRAVFLSLIFNSLSIIQNTILARRLDFKSHAKASIIAVLISGILSVIIAYKGFGVWALAVNILGLSLFRSLALIFFNRWLPSAVFSIDSIKKVFYFGTTLMLQNLLDKVVTNLETFMVGKLYSKSALGQFSQSRTLNSYITTNITTVIQTVTYPAITKLEPEGVKHGYRSVFSATAFVLLPLTIFFSVTADNSMVTIFGEKWLEAGPFLTIWTINGIFVGLSAIFINIFLVKGDSKKLATINTLKQILRVVVIFFLAKFGIMILLYGILVVTVISSLSFVFWGAKLINYSLKEIFIDVRSILIISIISGVLVYSAGLILSDLARPIQFAMQLPLMGISYFGLMHFSKNKSFIDVKSLIKIVLKK